MQYRLSAHAQQEAARRGIPIAMVDAVLNNPEQVISERDGRKAYQARMSFGEEDIFLVRVIVVDACDPAVVVTVYRTKKITKYWRAE